YTGENNNYLPVCGLPMGQNPWQSYSACRVDPGFMTLRRGFICLGLLWRTKAVPDPKVFYCPSSTKIGSESFSYDYYSTAPNSWPSTPGAGDEQVRTAYNYFPQSKDVGPVGGSLLPLVVYTRVMLEVNIDSPSGYDMIHMKQTQADMNKSISTDLVHNLTAAPHKVKSSVAGLNALFGDGHVVYQN